MLLMLIMLLLLGTVVASDITVDACGVIEKVVVFLKMIFVTNIVRQRIN